jgi:anaphase-promoting complex subunit 10
MVIHNISIYTDFKLDESYTPNKISIRSGTTFHDLQEIHVHELTEPIGWQTILPPREQMDESSNANGLLRTHFVQVAVLANHQNGRDTHIRQIKIYTPRRLMGQHMSMFEFNTVTFEQFACLR